MGILCVMKPRSAPRVPVKVLAIFTVGSVYGQGRVLDFSIPGCLMESSLAVKVGDRIQLKCFLPVPQPPLCVTEGVVRWVKGTRFGVEFVKMSEKDRRQLNQFVAMLLSRYPQNGNRKFSESGGHNWHLDTHSFG